MVIGYSEVFSSGESLSTLVKKLKEDISHRNQKNLLDENVEEGINNIHVAPYSENLDVPHFQNVKKVVTKEKREDLFLKYYSEFENTLTTRIASSKKIKFTDLLKLYEKELYGLRLLLLSVLLEQNFMKFDDDFFNNEIIDVYQKNEKKESLNNSVLKSLEMARDNNIWSEVLKSTDAKSFNEVIDAYFKNGKNIAYTDADKAFQKKFKNLTSYSLAIDLSHIVFLLKEEGKVVLNEKDKGNLETFLKHNVESYEKKAPEYNAFIKENNLVLYIQTQLDAINSFIKLNNDKLTPIKKEITEPLQKRIFELIALKDLKKNWDDEDADPIDLLKIEQAFNVLAQVFINYLKVPYYLCPTVGNGVKLEYRNNDDKRLDIRFESDPPLSLFFEHGKLSKSKNFEISDLSLL